MRYSVNLAVGFLSGVLAVSVVSAGFPTEDLTKAAAASEDEPVADPAIEQATKDFFEIVLTAAADFDSPMHDLAFERVKRDVVKDPRFDDAIRKAMVIAPALPNQNIARAVRLMPFSFLTDDQKITLMLDTLVLENQYFDVESTFKNHQSVLVPVLPLIEMLNTMPKALSGQLKVRLDVADPPAILCAAARATGSSGGVLLPILAKAMKSGAPAVQVASLRSFAMIQDSRAALQNPIVKSLDNKLLDYSKKIIARYDGDGDGMLSISEQQKMLVAPSHADLDSDSEITVDEFAAWMAKKSQR